MDIEIQPNCKEVNFSAPYSKDAGKRLGKKQAVQAVTQGIHGKENVCKLPYLGKLEI